MANHISNRFPWNDINAFVHHHRRVFTPSSSTIFSVAVLDTDDNPERVVSLDFHSDNMGKVRVNGVSYQSLFGEAILDSGMTLDVEDHRGKISMPQYKGRVLLGDKKCKLRFPSDSSKEVWEFGESQMRIYWKVLQHVISEQDEPINDAMKVIELRKAS
jgi:hypothetical protein